VPVIGWERRAEHRLLFAVYNMGSNIYELNSLHESRCLWEYEARGIDLRTTPDHTHSSSPGGDEERGIKKGIECKFAIADKKYSQFNKYEQFWQNLSF